jgi:hypothetical protein
MRLKDWVSASGAVLPERFKDRRWSLPIRYAARSGGLPTKGATGKLSSMKTLLACLLLVCTSSGAQTRMMPTDADLKTAYCITVVKKNIQMLTKNPEPPHGFHYRMIQELLGERQTELNRLQSYLVPKISSLEASGLIAATKRAEADIQEQVVANEQCSKRCESPPEPNSMPGKQWAACMTACAAESPASVRVTSCRNINWLPF